MTGQPIPRATYPKCLMRPYEVGKTMVNKPFIRPYFSGGYVRGGWLISHGFFGWKMYPPGNDHIFHLEKRKIIFKHTTGWGYVDMLVPRRVNSDLNSVVLGFLWWFSGKCINSDHVPEGYYFWRGVSRNKLNFYLFSWFFFSRKTKVSSERLLLRHILFRMLHRKPIIFQKHCLWTPGSNPLNIVWVLPLSTTIQASIGSGFPFSL